MDLEARLVSDPNYKRHVMRTSRDHPLLMYPGVTSADPRWAAMTSRIADRLSDEFPASGVADGYLASPGVPADFQSVRNLAGFLMQPQGVPTGERNSMLKQDIMLEADRDLLMYISKAALAKRYPKPLRISRISSTGPLQFSKSPQVKLESYERFFEIWPACMEWTERQWLDNAPWASFTYSITRRIQADSFRLVDGKWVPKERTVTNFAGEEVVANKHIAGLTDKFGVYRKRVRTAWAASASWNYALQSLVVGYRAHMLEAFHAIFEFPYPETISEALSDCPYVISVDVKNFDQSHPGDLLSGLIDSFQGINEQARAFMRASLTFPVLITQDGVGKPQHRWIGNPLKPMVAEGRNYGLTSGIAFVDIFAKLAGVFIALKTLIDTKVITTAEVDEVLSGSHRRVRLLAAGDNLVFGLRTATDHKNVNEYLTGDKNPYYNLDVQRVPSFLGFSLIKEDGAIRAVPNLVRYAEGLLTPERGIDSPMREHWRFAYHARSQFYDLHPLVKRVNAVIEEESEKHIGKRISDIVGPNPGPPPQVPAMNYFDARALIDPTKLHHAIEADQLSSQYREIIYLTVPEAAVERHVGVFFE